MAGGRVAGWICGWSGVWVGGNLAGHLLPELKLKQSNEDAEGSAIRGCQVSVVIPPLDQRRGVRQVMHGEVERLVLNRPVRLVQRLLRQLLPQGLEPGVPGSVHLERQLLRISQKEIEPYVAPRSQRVARGVGGQIACVVGRACDW